MPQLVQVPYQSECWLTPDMLSYLEAVNARMGTQLQIDGADGAWRPYARQAYLYNGYINHLPGFNTASNPDTGQRNHMRGAAFDLVRTDPAVQAACRAVGLIRDSAESWHWNDPNWQNMPIIPTLPGATIASDGSILLEDDMPTMSEFLNTAAYDGGPTISQVLKDLENVYQGTFTGGPSMRDGGKSISQSLAEINSVVGRPVTGRDRGDGKGPVNVPQIQDNADTNTMARQLVATVGALQQAVTAIATSQGVNPAAIQAAAQAGAEAALKNLTLKPVTDA